MDASERRARAGADAAEWWLKLQSGDISRVEKLEYVNWLCDSTAHVAEMLRIAQVHNALDQFERWSRISTEGADEERVLEFPSQPSPATPTVSAASETVRGRRGRIAWVGALAASLLVAVTVSLLLPRWIGQTIETERGERREIALNDGSVLQLDPETKLHVKLEAHARRVILERGRALFRVAKDKTRPFTVQADDTIVRAVGTAFAVDRRHEAVTVTVAEGKVAVIKQDDYDPRRSENELRAAMEQSAEKAESASVVHGRVAQVAPSPKPLLLIANQQVTLDASGAARAVKKIDTGRELAWTHGRLVFDNQPIGSAAEEFNHYNRVRLRVADATLAERPISGIFNASDPESFIAFIQTVTHVRIDRDNDQEITITSAQ